MITPLFIFTVFMLTLGPIKTVPAFFAMTQGQAPDSARALALQGTTVATAVSIVIALVMTELLHRGGSLPTTCGSPAVSCCSPRRAK